MATRNVTLSVPEDLLKRARVLAAQRDTSVSALVTELLEDLVGGGVDYATAWETEEDLMKQGIGLQVGEVTWTRDELHSR